MSLNVYKVMTAHKFQIMCLDCLLGDGQRQGKNIVSRLHRFPSSSLSVSKELYHFKQITNECEKLCYVYDFTGSKMASPSAYSPFKQVLQLFSLLYDTLKSFIQMDYCVPLVMGCFMNAFQIRLYVHFI